MKFIHSDFLLQREAARRLYHTYAEPQPILDFHCHLSPKVIAENRPFRDLTEICLEGDHYKWRAMRANGVPEQFCTGDAEPYDKFLAWARTVPRTLRNPLYHWTHLELLRYFDIDEILDEKTAPVIWRKANERLQSRDLTPQGILRKFRVTTVCTTDDPVATLEFHERIENEAGPVRVYPAFRPDGALRASDAQAFNRWTDQLAACTAVKIDGLVEFLKALRVRHDAFHAQGCRLSDHGLNHCFAEACSDREAESLFAAARSERSLAPGESAKLNSYFMQYFGRLDAEKGWTKQLHLGALRNINSRMLSSLGPDTGYDSMGDWSQASHLSGYLDRLEKDNALPKMILFNVNPVDNYLFATIAGCFQSGETAGKIQFGGGWWFLDQKEGMEMQLNALSNCGLLSRFVGMVTDSRSFLSFPRHEYFRRVLCNLLGEEMEKGLLPNDDELVGGMIKDICFQNAFRYLALPAAVNSAPAAL
ncbi:MAG: glucuronate isomerase [Candidatus Acidiferrum sp.]